MTSQGTRRRLLLTRLGGAKWRIVVDSYGICRLTHEDAKEVRSELDALGSVVFPLSGDPLGGCMIVVITKLFSKVGVMPFGGNPSGRIFISIYGRGCSHFSTQDLHANYFSEKLNISEEEAGWLAEFWRLMWNP